MRNERLTTPLIVLAIVALGGVAAVAAGAASNDAMMHNPERSLEIVESHAHGTLETPHAEPDEDDYPVLGNGPHAPDGDADD